MLQEEALSVKEQLENPELMLMKVLMFQSFGWNILRKLMEFVSIT